MMMCCVSAIFVYTGMTAGAAAKIQMSLIEIVSIAVGMAGLNCYIFTALAMCMANFGESVALLCGFCHNLDGQLDYITALRQKPTKDKEGIRCFNFLFRIT